MVQKRYLNRREAAEYLGIGFSTLNNACYAGTGPKFVKCFGRVTYDIHDLDAWAESHKTDPAEKVKPRPTARPRKLVEALA